MINLFTLGKLQEDHDILLIFRHIKPFSLCINSNYVIRDLPFYPLDLLQFRLKS